MRRSKVYPHSADEQKQLLIGHVAVADAICYIFGTLGVILCCSSIGPKLLRIDLRTESKKEEAKVGILHRKLGVTSAWQPIGFPGVQDSAKCAYRR